MDDARLLWGIGAVLAVFVLLPALAVGIELGAFSAGSPALVALTEGVTGEICHHDPARTLVVGGRLLPVCARCTGLYVACAGGGFLGLLLGGQRRLLVPLVVAGGVGTVIGLGAALAEAIGHLHTSNLARLGLGGLLGLGPTLVGGLGARVLLDEARSVDRPPKTEPDKPG